MTDRVSGVGRREFLAAAGVTGLSAAAGCFGILETEPASREPALPENRPDAVYVPTHFEGMEMAGMQMQGRYACALMFTFPHRFWLVRGTDTDRVNVEGADDVHMMATVWDTELGVVLPEASPEIEYTGPEDVTETFSPWQMLSQRMGVHHGDNITMGPEGTYDVAVQVTPPATERTADEEVQANPVTFEFELEYDRDTMDALPFEDIPGDREGTEGALDLMDMDSVSKSVAPPADSFPETVLGTASSGDADLVVATFDERGTLASSDDETYLAVSMRTPYSRFVIPAAALSATVETAGGETVYADRLTPTLDADLNYHYSAVLPTSDDLGDVTVNVDTPPQVSRHEGYETAFFDFEDVTIGG